MASIKARNGKYCVIYYHIHNGKTVQRWETYETKTEAVRRKKEVEYRLHVGDMIVPKCVFLRELLEEFVELYGKDNWTLSTYEGNLSKRSFVNTSRNITRRQRCCVSCLM